MQSININTVMKWLTAEQALKFLGVRSQTLYANVSRGRIRAKPDPADPRRSLYNGNDVARLAERRAGRRSAETVASQAIGWGDPVLASGISTIASGRLWYRGRDAVGACRKRHPGRGRRAPLADLGHAPACRSSRGEIRARRDADRPASVGRIGTGGDRSAVAGAFAGGSEIRS